MSLPKLRVEGVVRRCAPSPRWRSCRWKVGDYVPELLLLAVVGLLTLALVMHNREETRAGVPTVPSEASQMRAGVPTVPSGASQMRAGVPTVPSQATDGTEGGQR